MKSYIDDMIVTDPNGEKAILYPRTKQEAVDGLLERLANAEKPDITEITETTMPNSFYGRFLFKKIKGKSEQGENPSPSNPQEVISSVVSEIKSHGKNLIPYPYFETTKTQSGIAFTDLGDGRIKVNGTSTNIVSFELLSEPIKLDANKRYTITGSPQGSAGSTNYAILAKGLKPDGLISNLWVGEDGLTFSGYEEITVQDGLLFRIRIAKGVTVNNLIFEPMLRLAEDSDATFEPYKESVVTLSQPIELRRIEVTANDDYTYEKDGKYYIADTIEKIDGEYNKVQRIGERVYDGINHKASYYSSMPSGLPVKQLNLQSDGFKEYGKSVTYLLSDKFIANTTQNENTMFLFYNSGTSIPVIFLNVDTPFTTLDEANVWLQNNNVLIQYELEEPIITPLPTADQIALNSIETFDGITHMEFDSEIKPEFEGEYGTSKAGGYMLESLLTARNNDIRISSVEATVVNNI